MHHIVHQHSILNPSIDYADDREQNGKKGHWYEQDKITYRARRQDYLQELYSYECSNEEIQYWESENAEFSHPCQLIADSFDSRKKLLLIADYFCYGNQAPGAASLPRTA